MFSRRPYDHRTGSKPPVGFFLCEPFDCFIFALMGIHSPQVTRVMKSHTMGVNHQNRRRIALSLDDDRIIPGRIHGFGDSAACIRFRIETRLGRLGKNAVSG
jgi:hypothetical protein